MSYGVGILWTQGQDRLCFKLGLARKIKEFSMGEFIEKNIERLLCMGGRFWGGRFWGGEGRSQG